MDIVMVWTVAVGIWASDITSLELSVIAKQVIRSARRQSEWDAIGSYTLKGGKAPTTVKLYYADSDSIADKAKRRGDGDGGRMYPNFLHIHAVYREGDGPWKYKKLYGAASVGFWKVAEVNADDVTIQIRSKAIIFSNSPIHFTDEQLKQMYAPVSMRLTLKDGVPSLE